MGGVSLPCCFLCLFFFFLFLPPSMVREGVTQSPTKFKESNQSKFNVVVCPWKYTTASVLLLRGAGAGGLLYFMV